MGRCIVSRGSEGVSFLLESDHGEKIVVSKAYASLDTCKKGIAALIGEGRTAPLVWRGKKAPNPKIEVFKDEAGYRFVLRSVNGKDVLSSRPYATEKALRRAVAMLRRALDSCEVIFCREAEEKVLRIAGSKQAPRGAGKAKRKQAFAATSKKETIAAPKSAPPSYTEEDPDFSFAKDAATPLDKVEPAGESERAPIGQKAAEIRRKDEKISLGTVHRVSGVSPAKGTSSSLVDAARRKEKDGISRGIFGRLFKK